MKKPERWMMPFLTGQCFDFALALAEKVEDPVFVAVGSPDYPEHVALRIGEQYADVRGLLGEDEFLAHMKGMPISEIDRAKVEFHCGLSGMQPPYKGVREIAAARKAVKIAFPKGIEVPEATPAPTLR